MRTTLYLSKKSVIFLLFICSFFTSSLYGQVVINEVLPPQTVELKNIGTSTVDVSSYWLCNFPSYNQLNSSGLSIDCGSLMMAPGAILTVSGFNNLSSDSEMGLYNSAAFSSTAAILDYVEWGSSGHTRSTVAVAAGIWTTGAFVPSVPSGSSIEFDGDGNSPSDWLVTATSSLCAENSNADTCGTLDGGTLTALSSTSTCAGDGIADSVNVGLSGNTGQRSAWVITDATGVILDLPSGPPFNFEGAGPGVCLIWFLSYEDGLTGLTVGLNANDMTGCFDLSNAITVNRTAIVGGTISTTDPTEICVGNGVGDPIDVSLTGNVGMNSQWVITDDLGNILALPAAPPFDLEGAGPGVCLIWHLSYEDGLTGAVVGNNATTDLTGACYALSNSIAVTRTQVDGGEITALDPTTFCAGDGNIDTLGVLLVNPIGANSQWVITDTLGNILDLPTSLPFDFEGTGAGVCLVWHLAFEDGLTGAMVGNNASDLVGCFDLSNSIRVTRYSGNTDGGIISTSDVTSTCAGDGIDDIINVSLSGTIGANSQWVITDQAGIILDLPAGPPFNFEGAGVGLCLIWHLSFEDGLEGAAVGLDANAMRGCYDLSNAIAVDRTGVDGGVISTTDPTTICAGDGVDDFINVTLMGSTGNNSQWVVTDPSGNILALPTSSAINLEGAGAGVCLIWHLSFEDGLTGAMVGNNASDLMGCFDLSNSITVTRTGIDGGVISTMDPTTICAGDGTADPINVSLSGNIGMNSQWVITDPLGNILDLPAGPPFDFEGAGNGTCLIWHLSYEDGLTGAMVGNNASDLVGCFDLSDPIAVTRNGVNAGEISTTDVTVICAGDSNPDPIDVAISGTVEGANTLWVITDTLGEILGLPLAPPFDLDGAGQGTCLIWHLAYEDGLMGAALGNNANDLVGCYDLSNPIRVVRFSGNTAGGLIATTDPTDICAGDGIPNPINVTLTGNVGSNSAWVITDPSGNILGLPAGPPFDLDDAGAGTCLIWHLSFEDGLQGAVVGNNANDLLGCYSLSNAITVNRTEVNGGMISTTDPTTICAGDGVADPINVVLTNNIGDNSAWVITDTLGNILGLPMAPPFDLEGAGAGVCLIWHLSYADGLMGVGVGNNASDLVGCFELSNPITVTRNGVNGGMISTMDPTTICAGDGTADPINVTLTGAEGDNSAWVITDTLGEILGLPTASPFDLEGAGAGVCLIWHLSFADGLTGAMVGNNASDLMGCFDLSNPIRVTREVANGGTISTNDPTVICAGDGTPNPINVTLTGNEGDNSAWVITDTLGEILALPPASPFDLDGAGAGVCLIWHLSYADGLTGVAVGNNASDLMGCHDLSNPIRVVRSEGMTTGGTISTTDPTDICAGDGNPDPINVTLTGNMGSNSAWVITDTLGNILALPPASPFDLEGAGGGVCLIWHLSFEDGLMGAMVGNNASDLQGCFSLSNSIAVTRNNVAGGTISTTDETTICAGDGIADPINVSLTGNEGANSAWVITDTLGNILGLPMAPPFDLDDAGEGVCLIWHLSFEDGLTGAMVGNNASDLQGCFNLSNSIAVTRNNVAGGTISTTDATTICAGDGIADPINVSLTGNEGANSAWVITDTLGNILGLPMAPPFDLDDAGEGVCLIWHLSFEDGLTGAMVGNNASDLQGCFNLSNSIAVTRNNVAGGMLSTNGPTTVCVGDDVVDSIFVDLTGAEGANSAWVITDTLGEILGLPAAPPFNLEGAGTGTCLIWHLSFEDGLTGAMVGNNASDLQGCFNLSNSVAINRVTSGPLCVTSTYDVDPIGIRMELTPNPVEDELNLQLELDQLHSEKTSIRITSAAGQLIRSYEYRAEKQMQVQLNVEDIASGIYLISVQNDTRILTERFVKF